MAKQIKTGHRQRLRERFLAGDNAAYTDEALLELLLMYAIPQRDVQPLAKKLLQEFGTLSNVLAADVETLGRIKGIKSGTAVLLKVIHWLQTHTREGKGEPAFKKPPKIEQPTLFEPSDEKLQQYVSDTKTVGAQTRKKTGSKRSRGLFSKAELKEAIALLPALPNTDALTEVRQYLSENLHYNAEQTRYRYAHYIIRRMFPNGRADQALRMFAKHFRNSRDLKEVCFYRFVKAEPLMEQVIEDLLLPGLGSGQLQRENITEYLINRFPGFSVKECAWAIVDALRAGGIVKANRVKISFAYREISLPAFAFVLHSEFPEPGMYDLAKLETDRTIRAMLWNPDRILPSLYELRNQGLISKVSEIDNVRQFTTKWTLAKVVEYLMKNYKNSG